jgi:hypothetical protein
VVPSPLHPQAHHHHHHHHHPLHHRPFNLCRPYSKRVYCGLPLLQRRDPLRICVSCIQTRG